jgi:hypothetical protein
MVLRRGRGGSSWEVLRVAMLVRVLVLLAAAAVAAVQSLLL